MIVYGTSTLTNCQESASKFVYVKPIPQISLYATPPFLCKGNAATLSATGATTYSWSNGANRSSIIVTPSVSTGYTVLGAIDGCLSQASLFLGLSSPTFTINAPDMICLGEAVSLSVTGNYSYTWNYAGLNNTGTLVTLTSASSIEFTVTATDGNQCSRSLTHFLTVDECTTADQISIDSRVLKCYPNPTKDWLTLETFSDEPYEIYLFNYLGNLVTFYRKETKNTTVDLRIAPHGVYFLKVLTDDAIRVIKVVRE